MMDRTDEVTAELGVSNWKQMEPDRIAARRGTDVRSKTAAPCADENTLLSSAVISATAGTQQHQFTLRSGSMVSITASCVLEYYDEMAGAARCAVQSPT